jgi:hypothetical protein
VSTQRFTTSPGCSQRTARRERLIRSCCCRLPRLTQLGRRSEGRWRGRGFGPGAVGLNWLWDGPLLAEL